MTLSDDRVVYTASAEDNRTRIDVLLAELGAYPSRSMAVKAIESGAVTINGELQTKKYLVCAGDIIAYIPPARESVTPLLPAYDIPLDIRFEDDHLIVLSKQAGLVCHPSLGHDNDTLVNALIAHCGKDHLGMLQGEDRPGLVHRLDRDTTGLMLAAKDDETQEALQDGIRVRSIDRRYLTLVHGYIAPDTGLVDAPIARGGPERKLMVVSDDPAARQAITTFTVLERFEAGRFDDGYTFVECKLYTGRTHQIRVHMKSIHHPVVGDPAYGLDRPKANLGLSRQFLHSYSLAFVHPITGEDLSFLDPLPEDLAQPLAGLSERSMGRTQKGDEMYESLLKVSCDG